MKDVSIKGFGTKLMTAGKSINNIPTQYMQYSQNARIYDGGIGPRKGKQLLTDSVLGTNNKGAFLMNNKLYQICNTKIYEVSLTTGVQTEKATLGYDAITDILVYGSKAVIVSDQQALKVFDGAAVSTPATVPATNNGIIEYCLGYSFLASDNILYISRPIVVEYPENAYDFTGNGNQTIGGVVVATKAQTRAFDKKITGLKATLTGIYIFQEDKVDYINANSLQNIAGSATFVSTPIGEGASPINNLCIAACGEKIFYMTKNLQIQTINFIQGITTAQIGELSARPVIGIKELLRTIDITQPSSYAMYNENDKTIQFHARTEGSPFNDTCIVYDFINDTWNVDTGKNYNYVVKVGFDYYGFSDINSSIYLDDTGFSNAGIPIDFKLITQNVNLGSNQFKVWGGFTTSGGIGNLTELTYNIDIDGESVFLDTFTGNSDVGDLGEIAGSPVGEEAIAGNTTYLSKLQPFDKVADEGRMRNSGKRFTATITSDSQIQDFIIDSLSVRAELTVYNDIPDKF